MKYKKSKEMYVLPIIFIILFIIAIIVMSIYLKNNKISIRITGIIISAILLILFIIYFIYLIIIPSILIEVDDNHLYYKDYKIPLNDIDYTMVRKGALSMYHPMLIIMFKDKEMIRVKYLSDPYEASKVINKKYLKIKGNWVK